MKTLLLSGFVLIFATPGWAQALDPDYQLLKEVKVEPNGPELLKYFKERTVKEADPKEVAKLITQLGNDTFQVREKAYQELVKMGPACLVGLKLAEDHADVEVRLRVAEIKKLVMDKVEPKVQAAAARILAGRSVRIDTFIVPATSEIASGLKSEKVGSQTLEEVFRNAGAKIGPPSCAACLGGPSDTFGRLNQALACISTTNRNFPGRMGHKEARVYLASPLTVAASAVTGEITDPREFLE